MSSLPGARPRREPVPQRLGDIGRLVGGQRGLHQVGDLLGSSGRSAADVRRALRPAPSRPAPRPGCPPLPRGPRARSARPGSPSLANRRASACTLATSGHVASMGAGRGVPPRRGPRETRRARKTPRGAVRHLVELINEDRAPAPRARRRRGSCARSACARRPARPCRSSTRSTISMARSTPAQNERGPASRIWRCPAAPAQRASAGPAARSERSAASPPPSAPGRSSGRSGVSETARTTATGGRSAACGQRLRTPCPRASATGGEPGPLGSVHQVVDGDDPALADRQPGPAQFAGQQRRRRHGPRCPCRSLTSVATTRSPGRRSAARPPAVPAMASALNGVSGAAACPPRRRRLAPVARWPRPAAAARPRRTALASSRSGRYDQAAASAGWRAPARRLPRGRARLGARMLRLQSGRPPGIGRARSPGRPAGTGGS